MGLSLAYDQLPLFRRLPIPRGAKPRRLRSPMRRAIDAVTTWVQQEFRFVLLSLRPEDDDDAFDYPEHRIVSAAESLPVPVSAPNSIFALAAAASKSLRRNGRAADVSGFCASSPAPLSVAIVSSRADGITRHTGAQYPANRWTEEREEAERQRRARQRPPKPAKAARTRSRKLLELIGEDLDT